MRIGSVEFSPRPWSCMATAVFILLFARLGLWQLDRADVKAALLDKIAEVQTMKELTTVDMGLEEEHVWRRARLSGVFQASPLILLDNRVRSGVVGYYVYSVFQTDGGTNVLVNRGWIQAMPRRDELPKIVTPVKAMEIYGSFKKPPKTGRLLADSTDEVMPGGVVRLQYLDLAHVNEEYGIDVAPLLLRLEEGARAAFRVDWASPATGREKHLGYAFQWFAMAAALAVIFFVLNSKRVEKND